MFSVDAGMTGYFGCTYDASPTKAIGLDPWLLCCAEPEIPDTKYKIVSSNNSNSSSDFESDLEYNLQLDLDASGDSDGDLQGDSDGDYHGDSDDDYHGDSDDDYHGDSDDDLHGDFDGDMQGDSDGDMQGDSDDDTQGDSDGEHCLNTLGKEVESKLIAESNLAHQRGRKRPSLRGPPRPSKSRRADRNIKPGAVSDSHCTMPTHTRAHNQELSSSQPEPHALMPAISPGNAQTLKLASETAQMESLEQKIQKPIKELLKSCSATPVAIGGYIGITLIVGIETNDPDWAEKLRTNTTVVEIGQRWIKRHRFFCDVLVRIGRSNAATPAWPRQIRVCVLPANTHPSPLKSPWNDTVW
ncbi:hypothetical protein DL546_004842 [Coniochaeta pulveracea]|uniref:Uncharacterized protein n=1 Tax=Coniochaeta pulveracea TaxID=177199 RepID=A0A420Y124_9PEZI|nr:hypothetical protein DL546_004842 [Coniochaeta pulveracea]